MANRPANNLLVSTLRVRVMVANFENTAADPSKVRAYVAPYTMPAFGELAVTRGTHQGVVRRFTPGRALRRIGNTAPFHRAPR